jgi:hypothetical protein
MASFSSFSRRGFVSLATMTISRNPRFPAIGANTQSEDNEDRGRALAAPEAAAGGHPSAAPENTRTLLG